MSLLHRYFFLVLCFTVLAIPNDLFGQIPNTIPQSSPSFSDQEFVEELDTFKIYHLFADNPNQEYPFSDSLLNNNFQQYNPTQKRVLNYANLGNLGSAHYPLMYQSNFRQGFDVGLHQYDLYLNPTNKIKYHNIQRPYTRAFYSQGATQNDHIFRGEFSRNFKNGFNMNVDYQRINQSGQFRFQRALISAFAASLRIHPNEQYDAFVSFNTNTVQQQDNGGANVPSDNQFIDDPVSWSVALQTARTRHEHRTFSYTHHYQLNRTGPKKKTITPPNPFGGLDSLNQDTIAIDSIIQTDSLAPPILLDSLPKLDTTRIDTAAINDFINNNKDSIFIDPSTIDLGAQDIPITKRAYTLSHQFLYSSNKYKTYDDMPDSSYYENFYTDQRGLRNYIAHKQLENSFKISTSMPRKKKQDNVKTQRDLISVGLVHKLHFLDQEVQDSTFSNLFLTAAINFTPNERLKLKTYGHYGLLANRGDYRLSGDLFFDLKALGNLRMQLVNTLYAPSLVQEQLYISKKSFWNNNFDRTLETNLSVTYSLPQFKLELTGQYHLLNNFIYFDTLGLPKQADQVINIAQLIIQKDFQLGKLRLDNVVALQAISGDVIRLPSFYSKHSLYIEGRIIKKILNTRFGMDLRMTSNYFSNIYDPLTGQFHLQDQEEVLLYPAVDLFISFQLKKVRVFFKMENMTDFISERRYYQVAGYPMPFSEFRFGVSWKFTN